MTVTGLTLGLFVYFHGVFTANSKTERLCLLLTASNSHHYIANQRNTAVQAQHDQQPPNCMAHVRLHSNMILISNRTNQLLHLGDFPIGFLYTEKFVQGCQELTALKENRKNHNYTAINNFPSKSSKRMYHCVATYKVKLGYCQF